MSDLMAPWQAEAARELMAVADRAIAEHDERLRVQGWDPFAAFTFTHREHYRAAVQERLARALADLVAVDYRQANSISTRG